MRASRAGLLALGLLGACLDELLEAPYLLTSGVGKVESIAPTPDRSLLVASDTGLWLVGGDGSSRLLRSGPALGVASHNRRLYLLIANALLVAEAGPPYGQLSWREVPAVGARDIQAWCGELLLVAFPDGVKTWSPLTGAWAALGPDPLPARAVSLGQSCEEALVLTGDSLFAQGPAGTRTLATGLQDPRAVAMDRSGRIWLLSGAPRHLDEVAEGGLRLLAQHVGDARDIHFGNGELLAPDNVYLGDADGTIGYIRVEAR